MTVLMNIAASATAIAGSSTSTHRLQPLLICNMLHAPPISLHQRLQILANLLRIGSHMSRRRSIGTVYPPSDTETFRSKNHGSQFVNGLFTIFPSKDIIVHEIGFHAHTDVFDLFRRIIPHGIDHFRDGSGTHEGSIVLNYAYIRSVDAMEQRMTQGESVTVPFFQFHHLGIAEGTFDLGVGCPSGILA